MTTFTEIRATVRRRLLLSYRLDPEVAADWLPAGLRPQLVDGSAVAGVCLIALRSVRPAWLRADVGVRAESAAHRIAVEWTHDGVSRTGVYIRERHSASLGPVLGGGRIFPGPQTLARFRLDESDDRIRIAMTSRTENVSVDARIGGAWSSGLWAGPEEAAAFYEGGSLGWSPRRRGSELDALEVVAGEWRFDPVTVDRVNSSWIDGMPHGSAVFDSALVVRDVVTRWSAPEGQPSASAPGATTRRNT